MGMPISTGTKMITDGVVVNPHSLLVKMQIAPAPAPFK